MTVLKCFTAFWVSIIIYSLLSAFLGASSFSSYDMIFSEKERLIKNVENLKMINQELGGSLSALQYDSDTIAVYARELGYGASNERFIRITGLPTSLKKGLSAGSQILPSSPNFVSDKIIHIIAILAGCITLFCLIVFGKKMDKKFDSY
jgi:cell division protein FtsB